MSDKNAQTWILRTQNLIEDIASQFKLPVLLDRCLLDQYAYYCYWNDRNIDIEKIISLSLKRYYKIFVLPPNPNFLKDDGVRPIDPQHQLEISDLISHVLDLFKEKINVFFCKDNEIETVKMICSSIKEIAILDNTNIETNILCFNNLNILQDQLPSFTEKQVVDLAKSLIDFSGKVSKSNYEIKNFGGIKLW